MIPIDCKNGSVRQSIFEALCHIPIAVRRPLDATTKIVTTHSRFGYCMEVLQGARIIFLNHLIVPENSVRKQHHFYRWFVCVVMHEVAHAHLKHQGGEEDPAQEAEAWGKAIEWYNGYAPGRDNVP